MIMKISRLSTYKLPTSYQSHYCYLEADKSLPYKLDLAYTVYISCHVITIKLKIQVNLPLQQSFWIQAAI